VPAVVTTQAQEPVGEDPAAQVGPQLLLHEAGRWLPAGRRAGQKGLEPLAHHAVQERLLGIVAGLGLSPTRRATARLGSPRSKP